MDEHPVSARSEEAYLTDCEPIDWPELERWLRLTPGQRVQTVLNARTLAAGLIRGRLRRRYPAASDSEITWMMLAELDHGL